MRELLQYGPVGKGAIHELQHQWFDSQLLEQDTKSEVAHRIAYVMRIF